MPRCPSCSKILPSDNAVLRHMNQSTSRCFGWVDNLVQIGELLAQDSEENNIRRGPNLPAPTHWQPTEEWNAQDQEMEMEIDLPDPEPYRGTVEEFPGAAAVFAQQQNSFLDRFDRDKFSHERRTNLYYPFASRADWELGLWLTRSGLSMAAIDSLLSLELVSFTITHFLVTVTKVHISRSRPSPFLFARLRNCADSWNFFPADPNGNAAFFRPRFRRRHQSGCFTVTRLSVWRPCSIIRYSMMNSPSSLAVSTEPRNVLFACTVNGSVGMLHGICK